MTWVTLDDAAPLHRKQVAAGPAACWLWTCGLAYCDRQETKDGFIPDAVVKVLYPGLGTKEANTLVRVGLWERVAGGYLVHDYLEWREKRFKSQKSVRGTAGGSVRSEAKKQAALTREATKRVARQEAQHTDTTKAQRASTTSEHNESTTSEHNVATTTTSPTALLLSDLPSGDSDPVSSPEDQPVRSGTPRARGERPRARPVLLARRIRPLDYEPLPEHQGYAAELGLEPAEFDACVRDVRDKFGSKLHDEPWLDDKLCAFIEQAARSKGQPRRPAGASGYETPAERRTREQLERVAQLEAEERAAAGGAS